MAIKEEMNCQHRPKSIAIEEPSKLGKTEFIISYLNHQQLPFNYIRSALNFNKNSYNDKFKIDVYDDISIPEIRRAGLLKILSVVNEDLLLMLNIFLKENYPAINYQYFYVMKILASLFGVLLMLLIMVMNINI
jgi:hypothetical protein